MLVYNRDQIKLFFNTIFPKNWEINELAFVSLAARKKYILERSNIDLGRRPEWLDRDVVKECDENYYLSRILRFENEGYTDSNGNSIPDEVKAVYVNIHLSDTKKSWIKFKEEMGKVEEELFSHIYFHTINKERCDHAFRRMGSVPSIWYSIIQNTYSRKEWLDIDIDFDKDAADKENLVDIIKNTLKNLDIKDAILIHTRGGIHALISTVHNNFNKDLNPPIIRDSLYNNLKDYTKEVVINNNGMVPLPGTLQGGKKVWMEIL